MVNGPRSVGPTVNLIAKGSEFPANLIKSLTELTKSKVLVGVPRDTSVRENDKPGGKVNNALLAYIHDQGSPINNIPQREFLRPGIKNAQKEIEKYLRQAGLALMRKDRAAADRAFTAAGLAAQKSIRRKIQTGPFAPLKPATVRARKRKHPGRLNTKISPLIDTGQLLASINFVVKKNP